MAVNRLLANFINMPWFPDLVLLTFWRHNPCFIRTHVYLESKLRRLKFTKVYLAVQNTEYKIYLGWMQMTIPCLLYI